jgi:hypothetical protein
LLRHKSNILFDYQGGADLALTGSMGVTLWRRRK